MSFVIPSIFTAVDRYTQPMRKMMGATNQFIGASQTGIARQERLFKRLTPVLSETTKQFTQMAGAAAVAGGAIALGSFTIKSVMDYEKALASFRTIVSDLSNQDFKVYQTEIMNVAKATNRSSIDVAASFEKIAGLNADFAKTADGLGLVSQAAITLSKASGDELGASAESLVGIMNQFNLVASESDRVINVLAAGQAVGAASITQSAEAYKNFGSVAKGANITLEQSQALIQTLGKFSVFGAEAGTKLRGSILKLQQAGVGYKSGQFMVNDALEEASKKINKLRSEKEKDAALTKMFGAENISTGRILLANIEVYKQYTAGVTGTTEAQNAAAINTGTLANLIEELKAKFVNLVTGTDQTNESLQKVKNAIKFVTNNLGEILSVGFQVAKWMLIWKGVIIASRAALFVYNVALGISTALQSKSAFYVMGNAVAYGAYRAAVVTATAVQWLWNVALTANPIGLVIAAIALLVAGIIALSLWIKKIVGDTEGWGKQWDATIDWMKSIFKAFVLHLELGWKAMVHSFWYMVEAITQAWYWAQNKMGYLSDQQYQKNLAQIESERKARVDAIRSTAQQLAGEINKVANGPGWHVKWKTSGKFEDYEKNDVPYPRRISTRNNDGGAIMDSIKNILKPQEVTVKVQAAPGTSAEVIDKTSNVKAPVLSPTLGAFGK